MAARLQRPKSAGRLSWQHQLRTVDSLPPEPDGHARHHPRAAHSCPGPHPKSSNDTYRDTDFSRINEARHKWRRMDAVGASTGNLRRMDDPDARSDTASAYEELMYALRADMREEMLRMRNDLMESFSAVTAECKGLQRKDLSDAVAEIKADVHAAVKSSGKASRPESQQLNSILREIHDVKATLDTTALPAKTVVDHDVLRTEICKLDRRHLVGSSGGPAESVCCMLSTQICMLSTQLEKLRDEVLGRLDAPARGAAAAGREPLHGDMGHRPASEATIQHKVVEVLDVVARHQCELLEAIERVDVRPQVDVTPVVDVISRIDLKPHGDADFTKMRDAVENVGVRLAALEMFLQSAKCAP